ncbi:MAG: hypothetical protein HDR88_15455 [Bacteroides sp.]|nr:hypothetical protein [Bacteroides sp.]
MKPGTKLAILLGGAVVVWGLIALGLWWGNSPVHRAPEVAKTALYASVDNPESIKVLAVSRPDSVFGRCYINDDEKLAIATAMMKVNEQVMKRTDGLRNLDFEDNAVTELVTRQMSALSALRSLGGYEAPDAPQKPFSGWKVKIEYEAVSESGSPYRSEYWFILDRKAQCVVNSFEIPVI